MQDTSPTRATGTADIRGGSVDPSPSAKRRWRRFGPGLLGVAAVLLAFSVWAASRFDSLRDTVLFLQGVQLTIDPPVAPIGEGRAGAERRATFRLRNLSGTSATILGAQTSCTCLSTEKFPVTIPAGGSLDLHVTLHLQGKPGEAFEQSITYLTDRPQAPGLPVRLSGRIVE